MLVVVVVASVGFARAAYTRAARFEDQNGAGPWGGGPVLWGLVGLLFGLLGFLVLALAEKNTKKQSRANAAWATPANAPSNRYARTAAPAGSWAQTAHWAPPQPPAQVPPRPNVGGSDFFPGRK